MKTVCSVILILLFLVPITAGAADRSDSAPFRIVHPVNERTGKEISGNGQSGVTNEAFRYPILTQVLDVNGDGVAGVTVSFQLVAPRILDLGDVVTDRHGYAEFNFRALNRPEQHTVTATIEDAQPGLDRIVFQLPVRKPSWVLFMLFGLLGGLGLFLFGMDMMSSALQRFAGGRMRAILGALTNNKFIGVAVGAFVTMVIQSSSATTVMLVSFVRAGLMGLTQTLGVILGADIGTTVTAQLIAFKLTDYALLMIALGFGIKFLAKKPRMLGIGNSVLGFGILFFGMHIMSESMAPLKSYQPFLNVLVGLENPVFGIIIGTLFTALIQSSSAFTGIVIVLAQQGFLTLTAGIPLIFGANIGTCVTAILASMNAGREAKRVALAHTMFKVLGVLLFVWWVPSFAALIRNISPGGDGAVTDPVALARIVPRQIANAHTVFNVGLALVFLPLTGLMAKGVLRFLPVLAEPEPDPRFRTMHLDPDILSTPALALNLAKVEILRMGKRVKEMAGLFIGLFFQDDLAALERIHELEDEVDALDEQITRYLLAIGKQDISEDQAGEVYLMMHVTKQFEGFADMVDRDIGPLARKKISARVDFSESGRREVRAYHIKMMKQISRAITAFQEDSLEKAKKMTKKEAKYVALEGVYRQAHFERIRGAVEESIASSEIHIELMDCLRRLNGYTSNIARAMLARDPKGNDEGAPDDPLSDSSIA